MVTSDVCCILCEGCSAAPLTQCKNNEIKQELTKKNYFGDGSDERLYIDMRCRKGHTGELEKLTCDDGGVTLTIKLEKAAEKNETESYCLFTGWI